MQSSFAHKLQKELILFKSTFQPVVASSDLETQRQIQTELINEENLSKLYKMHISLMLLLQLYTVSRIVVWMFNIRHVYNALSLKDICIFFAYLHFSSALENLSKVNSACLCWALQNFLSCIISPVSCCCRVLAALAAFCNAVWALCRPAVWFKSAYYAFRGQGSKRERRTDEWDRTYESWECPSKIFINNIIKRWWKCSSNILSLFQKH